MSKTVHINSTDQFKSYLSNTEYVVVDFHATWCGPCHAIAPIFEKLANEHGSAGKIAFVKVDVDAQQDIAREYNITA
jgi:thioredoxin 1